MFFIMVPIISEWQVTGNRSIQAKCVASVTNCGLGLEAPMARTVNRGWQLFTNGKYWKYFSKLFHIRWRPRQVFQLNVCCVSFQGI